MCLRLIAIILYCLIVSEAAAFEGCSASGGTRSPGSVLLAKAGQQHTRTLLSAAAERVAQAAKPASDDLPLASIKTLEDTELWKYLELPSTLPCNFSGPNSSTVDLERGYISQFHQDEWVDSVLGNRSGLFAVESGASDGKEFSNTGFLETRRQWRCLLVEPNPVYQEEIVRKHRHCHLLRGALSPTGSSGFMEFEMGGGLGGLSSSYPQELKERLGQAEEEHQFLGAFSGQRIQVPTFPLSLALQVLGETVVDYWSIDTEGSELLILQSTNFSLIEVGLVTVEHNHEKDKRAKVLALMEHNGFKRVLDIGEDDFYVNPKYLAKRNLPMPELMPVE